jgi:hypothetical protein
MECNPELVTTFQVAFFLSLSRVIFDHHIPDFSAFISLPIPPFTSFSVNMCKKYIRYRWCQHNQEIWRPGPRTCRRAIRENARRPGHRLYRCSQSYSTYTQQMNIPCRLRQCRIDFKVASGFICCQCQWRNRVGHTRCHGPPERHQQVTDIYEVRVNTQCPHSVCHNSC